MKTRQRKKGGSPLFVSAAFDVDFFDAEEANSRLPTDVVSHSTAKATMARSPCAGEIEAARTSLCESIEHSDDDPMLANKSAVPSPSLLCSMMMSPRASPKD